MADVFRARLTGKIRDVTASDATIPAIPLVPLLDGVDPLCEVEAEILGGEFEAATVPCRFTTAGGVQLPWYAASIALFGTLNVTSSAAGAVGDRVYTVDPAYVGRAVPVAVRVTRDVGGGISEACIEIPSDYSFHAVVMAVAPPTEEDTAVPFDNRWANTNRGVGVVFPGNFAWLMFVAPDGTTYGSASDTPAERGPLGYYGGGDIGGLAFDIIKLIDYDFHGAQGLQPWTHVRAVVGEIIDNRGQLIAGRHTQFWHIQPADRPDAHIVRVFWDSGPGPITPNFGPGKIVTIDPGSGQWELATVDAISDAEISVRSPLQKFGVALWNNGVTGGGGEIGEAAVVVWGRFWLSPDAVPLEDNTTYYLNPLADFDSAAPNDAGSFTPTQPYNSPCHRPLFRHLQRGWCIMIDSEPSQHLAWAYEGENTPSGHEDARVAEMVFGSFPDADTPSGLLRWRDRPFDEDQAGDGASGEDEPAGQQVERHDVMAWFTGDTGTKRALVIKRLDLIFSGGDDDITTDPGWENEADRPGVLSWYYRPGGRIRDEWDLAGGTGFDDNSNNMLRAILATNGNDGGPGATLTWRDGGFEAWKWFLHQANDTGGPVANLTNFDDERRRMEWFVSHQYWGRRWSYRYFNGSDWNDAIMIEQANIGPADTGTTLTASLAASQAEALPLRIRELEICDDTDTVRKIMVIASDLYD